MGSDRTDSSNQANMANTEGEKFFSGEVSMAKEFRKVKTMPSSLKSRGMWDFCLC